MKKQNNHENENTNEKFDIIDDDTDLDDVFPTPVDWLPWLNVDNPFEDYYEDDEDDEDDDYNCVMTSKQLFSESDVTNQFPAMCMTADFMGGAFIIKDNRVSYALISFDEYKKLMKLRSEHYDLVVDKHEESDEALPSPASFAEEDPLIIDVLESLKSLDELSTSMLQRTFYIGYGRAARIIDYLTEKELVTPHDGARKRTVIATNAQIDSLISELDG